MQSEAEVEALTRLKNQHFNLGVFLAEAKRTVFLISSTASRIARQIERFRRQNPRLWEEVKRWQQGYTRCENWHRIPRKWLELQYGWKPLLSDIIGAMVHLELRGEIRPLINVYGKASRDFEKTTNRSVLQGTSKCVTALIGKH